MLFDHEFVSNEAAAATFDLERKRAMANADWEVTAIPSLGQAAYVRTSRFVEVTVAVLQTNKIVEASFAREDMQPSPIPKELISVLIGVAASATRTIGRHPENIRSIGTVPAPQLWVDPRTGVAPPQITR